MSKIHIEREVVEQARELALKAAMSAGNKLGVKSTDALRILAAFEAALSAAAEPVKEDQYVAVLQVLARFERLSHRMGELWERCQGKGWPKSESDEFTKLRDVTLPDIRSELSAMLSASPSPAPAVPDAAKPCGLTECQGMPRCKRCLAMDAAKPVKVDNWRQYAKDGENAQRCIERHRKEQDALLALLKASRRPASQGERAKAIETLNAIAVFLSDSARVRQDHPEEAPSYESELDYSLAQAADEIRNAAALLSAGPAHVEPLTEDQKNED